MQVPAFNNKTFNSISIYGFGFIIPSNITKNNGSETEINRDQWFLDNDLGRLDMINIMLKICDSIHWVYWKSNLSILWGLFYIWINWHRIWLWIANMYFDLLNLSWLYFFKMFTMCRIIFSNLLINSNSLMFLHLNNSRKYIHLYSSYYVYMNIWLL